MGEFYISGLQDGVTVYGLNKRQGERRHTERRTNGRRAGVPPVAARLNMASAWLYGSIEHSLKRNFWTR
jgi:hypothetical protein